MLPKANIYILLFIFVIVCGSHIVKAIAGREPLGRTMRVLYRAQLVQDSPILLRVGFESSANLRSVDDGYGRPETR